MYQLTGIRVEFEDGGEKLAHVLRLPKTSEMLAYERALARIASAGGDQEKNFLAALDWAEAKCALWRQIVLSIEGYDLEGIAPADANGSSVTLDLVPIPHQVKAVDRVLGKNVPRVEEGTSPEGTSPSNPPSAD